MTDKRIRCDACGKPALPIKHSFEPNRESTGELAWDYRTVDLCHEHAIERLQAFLQEPPKAPSECGKKAFSVWAANRQWKPKDI